MFILPLPNLLNNSYSQKPYLLNGKQYMFAFRWSNEGFCILDISVTEDNKQVYIVEGRAITINSNLIARNKDPELITGSLFCMNKYGLDIEPEQENFHKDYNLIWTGDDE